MRTLIMLLTAILLVASFTLSCPSEASESVPKVPVKGMVTMLDLGAKKCIPCKMMAPILEKVEKDYNGKEVQESLIDWKGLWKPMSLIVGVFLLFFWLPIDNSRFAGAVIESLALAKWYAQEHVILCLVPAFFIAGAIACFVSQTAVMKYLGAGAKKVLAYGVASVSGTILAVCSCTILPLFAGVWKRGAGFEPFWPACRTTVFY